MVEEILDTFDVSLEFVRAAVADLSEAQMVEQPAGAPNHAMWTLGHLAYSCQGIAEELGVAPWLPEEWESLFGFGSVPLEDSGRYPSKHEMLTLLTGSAERLADAMRAMSGADLARHLPDDTFPTMKHLLMQVVVAHTAYHTGQLAAWRRAVDLPSAGVFV
jgi:uncharacterized damage-inducible protein DinB